MNRGTALRIGTFALAGALAGTLVGGLGGRIAMRIAGAMSDPGSMVSPLTANGNVPGEITFGGTLALAFFSGLLPGLVGGVGYGASRPWLVPLGRWNGVAFGLLLLAAAGPAVLEPFNLDFQKFGLPVLNVLLFAGLFPLFGIAVAAASKLVADRSGSVPWRLASAIALAFFLLTLGVFLNALGRTLGGSREFGDPRGFFLLWFIFVPLAMRIAFRQRTTDARALPIGVRVASYVLLLAPAVLGTPSTLEAMLFLAR